MKQRNGVLGLDTAKSVIVAFLILAVTGIAVVLALITLQGAVTTSVDTSHYTFTTYNESDSATTLNVNINSTGYNLTNGNSSVSGYTIVRIWANYNQSNGSESAIIKAPTVGYNVTVPSGNYSVNSIGNITNVTNWVWPNVSITYQETYTYNNQRTNNIVGNVTNGIQTFFGSTGTIFSILVVVIIILAISIIIWAVGRFGQTSESEATNL